MNFIRFIFNVLWNTKWIWKIPSQKDIVIFDAAGAEILSEYLNNHSYIIFYTRGYYVKGESLYISIVLVSIFTRKFWSGKITEVYKETFLNYVSPKLVLTFIDNSIDFYQIKNKFPKITTMFVQNGWRGEIGDVFEKLEYSKTYKVDYMLVFNQHIAEKYKKYISGKTIAIGSLKNNYVKNPNLDKNDSVLFISQFRFTDSFDDIFLRNKLGKTYSFRQFYNSDEIVLRFLARWCKLNKLKLSIASYYSDSNSKELGYFKSILLSEDWQILPRIDNYSSYAYLDTAKIVVSIDSTLGYESLGRGNRTAIFSTRGPDIENTATKFGWPGEYPESGPFWTNNKDEVEFERIMNYLNTSSDQDWEKISKQYSTELMPFDPGNVTFVSTLNSII